MNAHLDSILVGRYPKIFKDVDQNVFVKTWGIECGDGWFWLLSNLFDTIQVRINLNKGVEQVVAKKISTHLGGLVFEYTGGDDIIKGMVELSEHMSYHICENCGSTEDIVQTKGWIKCLCRDCFHRGD